MVIGGQKYLLMIRVHLVISCASAVNHEYFLG